MTDIEKTALIKNWLGRKGLQLLEMLTQAEKEKYEMSEGLFKTLNDKFKTQDNETVKSLQFHKLSRHRIATTECNYMESDR